MAFPRGVAAMSRPLALDLFCGAGGAAMGLHRAGFDVIGVDNRPQAHYPFQFVQGDALRPPFDLSRFDFIWASPPCQAYSVATGAARARGIVYPDLVAATRALLKAAHIPYTIENVPGAPLGHHVTLCGGMFGLRTYRHRLFETSWVMFQPEHPSHTVPAANKHRKAAERAGHNLTVTGDAGTWLGKIAMGIDWMTGNELSQAIPPAYSEFIGRAALQYINARAAA